MQEKGSAIHTYSEWRILDIKLNYLMTRYSKDTAASQDMP